MWALSASGARTVVQRALTGSKEIFLTIEDYVRRNPKRAKRATAIGGAVLVHILFLLAVLITASDGLKFSGVDQGIGDAIAVTLARPLGSASAPSSDNAMTPEDALMILAEVEPAYEIDPAQINVDPDAFQDTDGDGVSDDLAEDPSTTDGDKSDRPADEVADGKDDKGQDESRNQTGAGQAGLDSAQVWAQIERCWRRPPADAQVPVKIEVTFGPDGFVVGTPKVLRPLFAWGSVNRDIAEARAARAIAACAPLRLPDNGAQPQKYTLDFNP